VTVDWGGDQISVKASKDFTGQQGDEIGLVIPSDRLFVLRKFSHSRWIRSELCLRPERIVAIITLHPKTKHEQSWTTTQRIGYE